MWGSDLFSAEYVQGDLGSSGIIVTLTHYIGIIAVFVISIVGFGIVMSSIMKNAMAGLYCTNKKLWDRVDDIKNNRGDSVIVKARGALNGKAITKPVGMLISGLCSILPNVKAMTDFDEDDTLDAKAYFMRSIPLMVLQIFIGVFIFYGYPSKLAAYAADFGTGVFDVVLTNVDPTAWVEAIPSSFANVTLVTDGATDDESSAVNKVSYAVIRKYVSKYSDITKSKRLEVALDIESWVMSEMTNTQELTGNHYLDSSAYEMSVECLIPSVPQDLSRVNSPDANGVYNRPKVGSTGIVTYSFVCDADTFDSGTTKDNSSDFVRVNLVFTPIAQKVDSSNIKSSIYVPVSATSSDAKKVTIKLNDTAEVNGWKVRTSGKSAVGTAIVGTKSVKVNLTVVGGIVTVEPSSSSDSIAGLSQINDISGLKYAYGTTISHSITDIVIDGSTTVVTFKPMLSDLFNSWTYGETPKKKDNEVEPAPKPETKPGGNAGDLNNQGK